MDRKQDGSKNLLSEVTILIENNKILELRELLEEYGELCRSEIASRCKKEDYIEFIQNIINSVEGKNDKT